MIQINPREIAAEALMEIMTADAYNTMTLRRLLRQNGAMSRQDRAFVTEVVNGTLRNLIYIDHVLNTFSKTKTEKMPASMRMTERAEQTQKKGKTLMP